MLPAGQKEKTTFTWKFYALIKLYAKDPVMKWSHNRTVIKPDEQGFLSYLSSHPESNE